MSLERREADQIEGVAAPEFSLLAGHEEPFSKLVRALDAQRLPGAILLHGPRGIGKATFAFNAARRIIAQTGDEPHKRVAAQIEAMSHPNLFVLRKAEDPQTSDRFFSAIRVDDVRATRDSLHQTRGRAGHRICIVDSIDDCNVNSANALLKTLEEPPSETLFIVISHRPGGLLPTIRSRCQNFGLRPVGGETVRQVLLAARPELDAETLERATALSGGRPRRAFETLMLEEGDALDALLAWLEAPDTQPTRAHLAIADALATSKGAELSFGQDILRDWMAREAQAAAREGQGARFRLASANALWDKANALIADADIYNLDRRQTLVAVFDLIREHTRKSALTS